MARLGLLLKHDIRSKFAISDHLLKEIPLNRWKKNDDDDFECRISLFSLIPKNILIEH